jgi:GNAT superfamily N-acetyltransferase
MAADPTSGRRGCRSDRPALPCLQGDTDVPSEHPHGRRDVLLHRQHRPARSGRLVAETNREISGFIALHGDIVEHLYVRPDLLRRGIGSALLQRAKERLPSGFRLWVLLQNVPARRFYERHGLRLVEETDGSRNEERTPDALYEWRPTDP